MSCQYAFEDQKPPPLKISNLINSLICAFLVSEIKTWSISTSIAHDYPAINIPMDPEELEKLKTTLRNLPAATQDNLAALLLMERLKRNTLIMPDIHKRVEDADPENWQTWEQAKKNLDDA